MSLQEGTGTPNPPHQMTQREAVFALVPTGNPSSLRFGHPDVTTGDTVLPRFDTSRVPHISSAPSSVWDMGTEALVLFLRSYRGRRGAAYFLRAYAGAPVTRTLRFLLASLRRASGLTP